MLKTISNHLSFWCAIAASLLLALNVPISGWAYILFMMSNITSLYIMRNTTTPDSIKYQIWFFMIINIIGIIRWLI